MLQFWMLSKQGEIRREETCIDYPGEHVINYPCHGDLGNQEWRYKEVKVVIGDYANMVKLGALQVPLSQQPGLPRTGVQRGQSGNAGYGKAA